MLRQRVLGPLTATTKALSEVFVGAKRIKVCKSYFAKEEPSSYDR